MGWKNFFQPLPEAPLRAFRAKREKMKLLTKQLKKTIPPLYSTEHIPLDKKMAVVKFFGGGRGTWFVVEGQEQCENCGEPEKTHRQTPPACSSYIEDFMFFGYVVSPLGPDGDEWGYFTLKQLESVRFPPFGLPMERDLFWTPRPMGEVAQWKEREE